MTVEQRKPSFIPASEINDCIVWQEPDVKRIRSERHKLVKKEPDRFELTQEDIDKVKALATHQGYEQGYEEGFQTGKADVEQQVKQLLAIGKALQKPLEQIDDSLEQQLVSLVAEMAKQVIHTEISLDPLKITKVLQEAINTLPLATHEITIYCHPNEHKVIEEYMQAQEIKNLSWALQADPTLTPGGCRLNAENSQVMVDLDTRLQEVMQRVLGLDDDESSTNDD